LGSVVVDEVAVGAALAGAALLPRVYLRAVPQEHLDDVGVAVVRGVVDGLVTAEILRQQAPRVPSEQFIDSLRPATLRGDVHGHDPARRHRIGPRAQRFNRRRISHLPDCAALCAHVYPSPSPASTLAPCEAKSSKTSSWPLTSPRHVAHLWLAA
jgi:hypothetical protein